MSLNFDFSKIANFETLTKHPADPDRYHPVTDKLIWHCLSVSLRSITEANAEEFYWRVRLLQRLDGPELQWNDDVSAFITLQDIRDHIGLSTNVTELKRDKWLAQKIGKEGHYPANQDGSARDIVNRQIAKYYPAKQGKKA